MRHPSILPALLVALTAALGGGGCGPIGYTIAINGAAEAVEEARQAGGPQGAPYEYHYAVEHLTKAREFASEAEYQNAMSMASLAEEYGNRARDIARRRQHESGR